MTSSPPLRLVVVGLSGRMGREIAALVATDDSLTISGGVGRSNVADLPALAATADVLIDFSTPEVTAEVIAAVRAARLPLVIGTTGLAPAVIEELRDLSATVPVWYARNMSTGVSLLQRILPEVTRALAGFDIEVLEAHHRHKVDAPSGTALMLAEAILAGLTAAPPPFIHGRDGYAPREAGEIGFHAIRGGGNPGEHTILFATDQEEVRISHRAFTRQVFAAGAIRAARTIHGAAPGWYGPDSSATG
jgi:4-hydroxy-tetrahydrodipicolinate reductase